MTQRAPHILLAGGGTGGHVYPAIAIADAIRELAPTAEIAFVGTRDRLEAQAVPKAGYSLYPITVAGFQRSLSMRNLQFPFKLFRGFVQSWNLVSGFNPDVAVGTGGYVAGPALLAAWLRRRPIVIQEQNAYAGVTNRLLSCLATRIHLAFPEAKDYVPAQRAVISGNPTRSILAEADRAQGRGHFDMPDDARVLLMFGGSLGSAALNGAMEQHALTLLEHDEALHIIWQTGARYYDALASRIASHPRLHLMKYIDRMDQAYAAADLVLCRAGAITCSELMVTGTPALLVPSPNVTADHQTKNARSMERGGAARLLPEDELNERLVGAVTELLDDAAQRQQMAAAARHMARPDAARRIAADILEIAEVRVSNDERIKGGGTAGTSFDNRQSTFEN
jgi:UDP-N-acetylglucosamine--N-acetylmuramyl-(pentapeptide) pyrophosphoryl-undecaprenol N-acetylglucosamine transferase